jgi:2-keto-4-pentenoate hydratase/2-oxohepta-3-ene-1,7-dioic acid hydratase in catechol pathway
MTMNIPKTQECIRIFCIGRNYPEHAKELENKVPETPVIFMKPPSCLVNPDMTIHFPKHGSELHHEAELVIQIGRDGKVFNKKDAGAIINAFTLGLDLTLRDLQKDLKQKKLPWEKSKAFEQSAPIGKFTAYAENVNLNDITFECKVNGIIKQSGHTKDMIFDVETLLVEISKIWEFKKGDLIFTGTPAGVGPLSIDDTITVESNLTGSFSWYIDK